MIWGGADVIIIEIILHSKCNAFESLPPWNHATKVGDHCSKHFLGVECFFPVTKYSYTFTAVETYGEWIALLPPGMSVFFLPELILQCFTYVNEVFFSFNKSGSSLLNSQISFKEAKVINTVSERSLSHRNAYCRISVLKIRQNVWGGCILTWANIDREVVITYVFLHWVWVWASW